MKIKSAFIPVAIAVFGFAFTAPIASALPPSKEPAWKHFQGKENEGANKVSERCAVEPAQRTHSGIRAHSNLGRGATHKHATSARQQSAPMKTIGLSVGKTRPKLRPYYQRKRGF